MIVVERNSHFFVKFEGVKACRCIECGANGLLGHTMTNDLSEPDVRICLDDG